MTELISFAALVALTTGVAEVLKRALGLDSQFMPLVALAFGLILTFVADITNLSSLSVLTGLAVGLSSSGLYDIGKKTILKK